MHKWNNSCGYNEKREISFNPEWHEIILARRIQNLVSPLLQNNLTPWARKVVLCDPSCFTDGKIFACLQKKIGRKSTEKRWYLLTCSLGSLEIVRFKIWEINLAHGVAVQPASRLCVWVSPYSPFFPITSSAAAYGKNLLIDRPFKHDIFRISYVVMAVSHIKSLVCHFENILL